MTSVRLLGSSGWAWLNQLKDIKNRAEASLRKKFCLCPAAPVWVGEFQPALPGSLPCGFKTSLARPTVVLKPILCNISHNVYLLLALFSS